MLKQHWIKVIGFWILKDFLTSPVNELVWIGLRISNLWTEYTQKNALLGIALSHYPPVYALLF